MPNFNAIKELNLPTWKFAIFGSSVISVRNIRESDDIDILVKQDLRDMLIKKYPNNIEGIREWSDDLSINLNDGKIEIVNKWIHLYGQEDEMIDNAEIINWLPFVKVEYFKIWKEKMWREKDKRDLDLLSEYEKKEG